MSEEELIEKADAICRKYDNDKEVRDSELVTLMLDVLKSRGLGALAKKLDDSLHLGW